ncbi:related to ATG11 - required for mitophagy [Ustilago sp. UG-2017a]|nr:related to ATG11 - required for mitophagy [Ustilago sp. UG-2017a]
MRVIRAYDGRSIVVNQPLSQFASLDDLLDTLSLATEIPSDAIICMTSDGSQLKQELLNRIIHQPHNFPSASSSAAVAKPHTSSSTHQDTHRDGSPSESQSQEFFVYNRDFLYTDPTELAAELAEHATFEPVPSLPDVELSFPPTPKSLEALVSWSAEIASLVTNHQLTCHALLERITLIARSLQVALSNLRDHADNIEKGAKALIDDVAQKELTRMQSLLQGYERDLRILGMVSIHPRLQSVNAAAASSSSSSAQNSSNNGQAAKPKHRTLGDYISKSKMSAVADACHRVYTELRERIEGIESELSLVRNDTQGLSDEVQSTTPEVADETYQRVMEAEARTRQLHAFIQSTCSPDAQGWPVADKIDRETFDEIVNSSNELLLLDEVVREGVQRLTQDRNDILERSLHLLIDISGIQSEFTETGSLLAAVDADLHSNKLDGFKHLHRLKNMLWAYGATVVEVVRRREFAKHFLGKSQSLAEIMAKVSASEWNRRQFYRSDISSLLPWEVKGMEDKPPSLEITTPRVSSEGMADLSLPDLEALYELLDHVDLRLREEESEGADGVTSPIPEVKAALQALAAALQDLDDEFVNLVNQQLLNQNNEEEGSDEDGDESGSDTSIRARKRLRRRQRLTASLAAANSEEMAQLRHELAAAKAAKEEAERTLKADNETRILGLKAEIETMKRQIETGKSDVYKLEAEKRKAQSRIETLDADLELERERRLNMVDEVSQLRRDLEQSHRTEAEARQEAMEDADRVAELEAQAHELHLELEEAKSARIDASNRIEALLSEGSSVEGELRTAQARIDELTEQLSNAHAEAAKAREAAAEVEAVKERQIRSYRAEADGDRAILEEKVRALKADLDAKEQLLEKQTAIADRAEQSRIPDREAIELLRGQLHAADVAHEEIVKEMDRAKELADEAEAARREAEASRQQLLERTRGLLAKTSLLRKTVRAMPTHSSSRQASSTSVAPNNGNNTASTSGGAVTAQRAIAASIGSLSVSEMSDSQRQAALEAFEAEAEGANFDTTLEALRAFDVAEMYEEVKGKLDSLNVLVRKWQKAWKSANEKVTKANAAAREKIAVRNFKPDDLALFLPTRNSNLASKPWAAFNISFPHFFLNAQGPLAEQLRTKEWIVARITKITDRVVPVADGAKKDDKSAADSDDPNPFKLPEDVRYFLLDVETYTGHSSAPPSLRSRKSSSAAIGASTSNVDNNHADGKSANGHHVDRKEAQSHPRSQSGSALTGVKGLSKGDQTGSAAEVARLTEEPGELKQQAMHEARGAGDAQTGPDDDLAAQASGFSLQSVEQSTPPMQTPESSPHVGSAAVFSGPTSTEKSKSAGQSEDKAQQATSTTEPRSATTTTSALTRALRSASPASSLRAESALSSSGAGRWRAGSSASANATQWPPRSITGITEEADARRRDGAVGNDGDAASSTTGSTSHRSTLIEHATMAPAFGRAPNKRRGDMAGRVQNASPSGRAARRQGGGESPDDRSFDGRGVTSAPASQSRSDGIAIRMARPALQSHLVDTAVSNPFSQSPGPASLPADRDGMGTLGRAQARRKSSLYISSSASVAEQGEQRRDEPTPKVQRWPSDAASKASQRTASLASTASASNQGGGMRINGRSIVFDTLGTSGQHCRQASSSSSAATTVVTTAHAIPGAFPSSFSSSGSLAGPSSPRVGADQSDEAAPSTANRSAFRSSSFGTTTSSRPALTSTQKPSFLSQTLGRFTGAAAHAVQGPPFGPTPGGESAREADTVGKQTYGRNSQFRPSLFQAIAPLQDGQGEQREGGNKGTPESAGGVSGFSNVSGSSAEGMLKRLTGGSLQR